MNRKNFLKLTGATAGGLAVARCTPAPETTPADEDRMGAYYTPLFGDGVRQWLAQQFPAAEDLEDYYEGIDISRWQSDVDHDNTCGNFAFVRASAADSACNIYTDSRFVQNATGFAEAGKPWDAYHFFRPQCDPVAQADFFANTIAPYEGDMLPVLDVEVNGGLSGSQVHAAVTTFQARFFERTGEYAMIYTSPGFWNGNVSRGPVPWELWVAHWGVAEPTLPYDWQNAGADWLFWQWGVVSDGIACGVSSRDLDHDAFNGDEQAFRDRFLTPEPPPTPECAPGFPDRVTLTSGDEQQNYVCEGSE